MPNLDNHHNQLTVTDFINTSVAAPTDALEFTAAEFNAAMGAGIFGKLVDTAENSLDVCSGNSA